MAVMCAASTWFLTSGYRFLAVNEPTGRGVLVVEGWIPTSTLGASLAAFSRGDYQYLVVVGGPTDDPDQVPGATYADLAAKRIEGLGVDPKKLIKINVPPVRSERTLTGMVYVKRWLQSSQLVVCCVDVFTTGAHARRSWMLARHALGNGFRVGIISAPESRFDSRHWWTSRLATWLVLRNLLGCIYYKIWIFFHNLFPGTQLGI